MRDESRTCIFTSRFEEKVLRDHLPENPTDADILNAIVAIKNRAECLKPETKEMMDSIVAALYMELNS